MNQIVIVVKGGIVQEVYADQELKVTVVDYDVDAKASTWLAQPLAAMSEKTRADAHLA